MSENLFSMILIIIDALCVVFTSWALLLYGIQTKGDRKTDKKSCRSRISLFLSVVFAVKMTGWLLFYLALWGFISEISGAMCIFGVIQTNRLFADFLQILKPFTIFLLGLWLIINKLDCRTKSREFHTRKFLIILVVSLAVILEWVGEIWWFSNIPSHSSVLCCTMMIDTPGRLTRIISSMVFGRNYTMYLYVGYWIANALLIGFMAGILFSKPSKQIEHRRFYPGAAALFSWTVIAPIFLLSMVEIIGPRLMKLPYHHCLFCMWQYLPASGLIFLFFVMGLFTLLWSFLVDLMVDKRKAALCLPDYQMKLYWIGMLCFGVSVGLVAIHHVMLI